MGGYITVESAVNQGTKFTFRVKINEYKLGHSMILSVIEDDECYIHSDSSQGPVHFEITPRLNENCQSAKFLS